MESAVPKKSRLVANRIQLDAVAPDFALDDLTGKTVRLSDYHDTRHVVLVFNRTFL